MSSFGEYVDGKTIAIVGPAPAPYDQSAEVDAHDIVYRVHWNCPPSAVDDPTYPANVLPRGYGKRADMAYYNVGSTRLAIDGHSDHVLQRLEWAITKSDMPSSGLTNIRTANQPPMRPGAQNQIPAMLWDLTYYHPASVTVFGADFYSGELETWYDDNYLSTEKVLEPDAMLDHTRGVHWHDQTEQRRVVRMVRDLGWLIGDDRFLKALDMTFEEYNPILESQLTRAHQANFP
jgi:hypothetical protein